MLRRPSDRARAGRGLLHPGVSVRLAAVVWTVLMTAQPAARADDRCAPLAEDLRLAQELAAQGKAWQSAPGLRAAAQSGCVLAMERLALLHWFGPALHPGNPWSREEALRWFVRADAAGSEVGRHMLAVARRTAPARPPRRAASQPRGPAESASSARRGA